MKNLQTIAPVVVLSFAVGFAASTAVAADHAISPEPGYDSATAVNITGTVTDVWEVAKGRPMEGLHLTLLAGFGTIHVYIAPIEFVKMFDVALAKGDDLKLTGSKVTFEGSTVLLASQVTKKTVTLTVRDKTGAPLWKYFLNPPQG